MLGFCLPYMRLVTNMAIQVSSEQLRAPEVGLRRQVTVASVSDDVANACEIMGMRIIGLVVTIK